jgi:hypothetical protein
MKRAALFLVAALAASGPVLANRCPTDAFLEVVAKGPSKDQPGKSFKFSEAEFLALANSTITTTTAWTPKSSFTGPELSAVLKAAGALPSKANVAHMYAIDSYEFDIPLEHLPKYKPVLAHTQNGKRLDLPTKGPIFLIYPRDNYPEMKTMQGQAGYVWMVCKIELR